MKKMSKKIRLQFDVTQEALEEIDALKELAGASTRAELLRDALRLYALSVQKGLDGYELQLRKGEEVQLPLAVPTRIVYRG